jgi:hypothetical protein
MVKSAFVALLLSFSGAAYSALVLHIDAGAEEVYFSGSDAGNAGDNAPGQIGWRIGAVSSPTQVVFGAPLPLDTSPALGESGFNFSDTGVMLVLGFGSPNVAASFSGNGNRFSYAAATDSQKSFFESQIGSDLVLFFGSGADAISIQGAGGTVPLPPTIWLFATTLLGLVASRARLRHMTGT